MTINKKCFLVFFILLALFIGCENPNDPGNKDTDIAIAVSVSGVLSPLDTEAVITVTVSGFLNDADAENVGLLFGMVSGLSYGSYSAEGPAAGGSRTFTVTAAYDGATEFPSGTASIGITLENIPSGYSNAGDTAEVSIFDGKHIANGTVAAFNDYANTSAGLAGNYLLIEDVILPPREPGESNWEAIGTWSLSQSIPNYPFTGTFDGQGFSISGLIIYATSTNTNQGMFGAIDTGGEVKNLHLENVNINNGFTAGGIVGYNFGGTIQNCSVTGSVSGTGNNPTAATGGIAGYNGGSGTVQNCYVTASVSGIQNIGGVVGQSAGTIKNNIALNPSISSGNSTFFGRVSGSVTGTYTSNYAWSGMTVPVNVTANAAGKDGGDLGIAEVRSKTAWETAGFVFNGSLWIWNGDNGLPSLLGVGTVQPWPAHLQPQP